MIEYLVKFNDMCVAKADTFKEKVRRRTVERCSAE